MARISLKTIKGHVLILRDKAFISASIWKNKQNSENNSNFTYGRRNGLNSSSKSKIFGFGHRPSALGPTLCYSILFNFKKVIVPLWLGGR